MQSAEKLKIKVGLVGDGAVGKTALILFHKERRLYEECSATVFNSETTEISVDGTLVDCELWDTGGQEDYKKLRSISYPGTDAFIICFNVASWASFESVTRIWLPELEHFNKNLQIILVGTKIDLRDDEETKQRLKEVGRDIITTEQGQALCKHIKAYKYMETSALTGHGVDHVFEEAVRLAMQPKEQEKEKKKSRCQMM